MWISEKKSCTNLSDQYFYGKVLMIKLMTPNLWHLKFMLFIDSFPISPICQPASQANKSGNEPANQSINQSLTVIRLSAIQSVSQSVSNWACQPVNWSEVLLLSHIRIDQWSAVSDDDGRIFWSWVVSLFVAFFCVLMNNKTTKE